MLKKFFLNILSSFVGTMVAIGLCGLALVFLVIGLIARAGLSSETSSVKGRSVLVIDLSGTISESERTPEMDLQELVMSQGISKPQALNVLVKAIEEAAANKNVKAVYIKCGGVNASPATLSALRASLVDFKKSGKKIFAYGDSMTQGDYFVATAADSLFLNPDGSVAIQGIGSTTMFFKGLFDKIGIKFTAIKVGTYKSAVEPYIQETMSEPARAQLDTLFNTMWDVVRGDMAGSRGIKPERIDSLIDRDYIFLGQGSEARKAKLVDALVYEREMDSRIASLIGEKKTDDVNFITPQIMVGTTSFGKASGKQVAVLYAEGEIQEATEGGINCHKLVPVIVKLADDDDVKALVLRVNSPGGSVFGSQQIAEALNYFKSKGKPFVVSMGDYAASGGYWISADADRIFANALTITGSIGIFGLIPDASELASKLGVGIETVATSPDALFPNLLKSLTPGQTEALQKMINQGYDQFIARVANGRKLPEQKVRAIAEGRVWSGIAAKELGLVDEIGGVGEAVKWAAKKANLGDNYGVGLYPETESSIWDLLSATGTISATAKFEQLGIAGVPVPAMRKAWIMLQRKPEQALMVPVKVYL